MIKAQDTWERQGVTINQTAVAYSIWEPDKDENGEVIYLENSREPAGYHYSICTMLMIPITVISLFRQQASRHLNHYLLETKFRSASWTK